MIHMDWFLVPCWGKSEKGGFYSVLGRNGEGEPLELYFFKLPVQGDLWVTVCRHLCPHHSHEKYSAKRRSYPCSGPVSISNPVRQKLLCWGMCHEITSLACCSWEKTPLVTHQFTFSFRVFLHARAAQRWAMPVYLFPKRVVLWLISLLANPEF